MQEDLQKTGGKNYFMEDDILFFWWVFSKQEFLPEQDDYFGLRNVLPGSNIYRGSKFFRYLAQHIDIDKRFDVGFYSDSGIDIKMPQTKEQIAKHSKEEQKIIGQINKKLGANKCLNAEHIIFVKEALGISTSEQIYFRPDPSISHNDSSLKEKLDDYIKEFLSGDLLVYEKNYFSFEKQKQIFIQKIRDMKAFENFGQNFIVSNHLETVIGSSEKRIHIGEADKRQVLFFHTLYALELLGFIDVLKIWFSGDSFSPSYYANILPHESFKELVYNDYRKENPKTLVLGFDTKSDTLTFGKKKIQFSKGKKETDAVLLMRSLVKPGNNDYLHEDEVLEEWGYRAGEEQAKLAKNKVYSACQKVQNTMKLEAGIDDFLEFTTSKVRINPQYLEVDK